MAPRKADLRPLDRAALEAAALAYLERYATSAENLRRVLVRRVRTHAHRMARVAVAPRPEDEALEAPDLMLVIDELVERYTGARLIDDDAYARGRAASLHRRGESMRGIRAKLQAKGVGEQDVRQAITALTEGSQEPGSVEQLELAAAWRIAQKRRLGPYRDDPQARAERRDKDIAALMRRGFSYSIAERVIRAPSTDAAPARA